ncbi:hypothetical protein K431DRAFT_225267 [Polychaeton citri CBS 116435]|uniref:Uncharacterized protein n=1 Tax=Polychaeton citri CBS 116435 TaxID=1314669 RepID=A0A9P4UNR2_9PEZI|nr:hypothetical protein K431DRAFT_225267 [Polychaeton citri CBS 116435]
MAADRPNLSITLPPSAAYYHNKQNEMPCTPEPSDQGQNVTEPPPPPKQTFKVRRKRNSTLTRQDVASEIVLPTIEMSSDISVCSSPLLEQQPLSKDFLAPAPINQRFEDPKTPEPRDTDLLHLQATPSEWDLITNTCADARYPARTRSVLSDSSNSTSSTSPFSVMPTSPASETTDPFLEDDTAKENKIIFSPHDNSPCVKRFKKYRDPRWTSAMDDHLWMTFMLYLSDPTLTPFKLMPGQVPPLGLCHKVAARAKKTWKPYRAISPGAASMPNDAADTIRASEFAMQSRWPRCEKAVRTRLRVLCKSKPSLPMHYQRLLRTRSPSPFTSSSPAAHSSEPPPTVQSAFSSRDLNVSLATATAPSMQPEGLLAQLAGNKAHVPQRPQSQRDVRPEGWFGRIGRSQAHQKSLSLQSGLGLEVPNNMAPPLASPFEESSGRSHLLHSMITTKSLGRNNLKQGNSLGPPFEGDPTMRRSLKRRFRSDEEKPKRLPVKDIFGLDEQPSTNVRNRGFSLGAVAPSVGLQDIFAPQTWTPVASSSAAVPSELDEEMTEAPNELPHPIALPAIGSLSVPRRLAEPTPRLGSPFVEAAAQRQHNTFPRSLFRTQENPQPFQQRLQELAREHSAKQAVPHLH